MVIDRRRSTSIKRSPIKIALAISCLTQLTAGPSLAFGQSANQGGMLCPTLGKLEIGAAPESDTMLVASATSKNMMQVPTFGKLDSGASPDQPADTAAAATPDAKPADLSPISISDNSGSTAGGDNDGMLKTTVTKNELVPKGPIENADALAAPTSVIKEKKSAGEKIRPKEDLLKNAEKVNLVPLALQAPPEEENATDKFKFNAEQQEMADLWDATLGRSQDIQFVIQKLMPSNNNGQAAGMAMKMISTAVFGGMGAGMMMVPNMGAQMGMNSGASMMYQALNGVQTAQAEKARLNETESIMLYKIVRDTADKLVNDFRGYKKQVNQLRTANTDLDDMQNMLKDVRAKGLDDAKMLEMEYTVRKQQRELDGIGDDVKRCRQSLVDLAGAEAVTKLDAQLINEATGLSPSAPSINNTNDTTAEQPQAEQETPMKLDIPPEQKPHTASAAGSKPGSSEKKPAVASKASADKKLASKQTAKSSGKATADKNTDKTLSSNPRGSVTQ